MGLGNALLRQPQVDTLPRNLAPPNAVHPATLPLLPARILAPAARSVTEQHLQIAFLRREPALDERHGVLGHAGEEGVLGFGLADGAHEEHDLLVDVVDVLERLGAVFGAQDAVEQGLQGVVERDLDVVDGGFAWGFPGFGRGRDVVFVHADRVLQLDGG